MWLGFNIRHQQTAIFDFQTLISYEIFRIFLSPLNIHIFQVKNRWDTKNCYLFRMHFDTWLPEIQVGFWHFCPNSITQIFNLWYIYLRLP